MNNDLIERYIYAVTKRMDRRQRDDVAQELRTLIEDMLAERCSERRPEEKDIRVVLTELGTPQELYSQYDPDRDKCLIGQPYYSTYKFVMKIVLTAVAVGMTIAHLLLALVEPQEVVPAVLGWLNALWNCSFGCFAFVTVLFAFFQRKGVRVTEPFSFEELPPVPKRTQEIPKWESIAGIVVCLIFGVVVIFTPEVFSLVTEGLTVSLFEQKLSRYHTL